MGSAELRAELRQRRAPHRDTRRIHELGRAYARERLHLRSRPRHGAPVADLVWSSDGSAYKVVTRTLAGPGSGATFEVAAESGADHLLLVLIDRRALTLVEMARVPWSIVEWLGRPHGSRWRIRWSESSALRGVAELL